MTRLVTSVNRITKNLDDLVKAIENSNPTPEQVNKSFRYLELKFISARTRAQAAAQAPSEAFSLDMDLPAGPPVTLDLSGIRPVGAPIQPAGPAPTRSGLTVEQLGGRFVRDVREAGPPSQSQDVGGVSFIDEDDEDETAPKAADDGVGFIDDEE